MEKKKTQEQKIEESVEKQNKGAGEQNKEMEERREEIEEGVEEEKKTEEPVEADEADEERHEEVEEDVEEMQHPCESELEKAKAEVAQYHDRWIRLAAEFENFRKRSSRQFAELVQSANERLVAQLLPVLDNFERALNHQGDEETLESFRKGVEMIFGQLQDVLEGEGLQPFDSVGRPFDPEYHDAMMQIESEAHESGTIVEEVQKGYTLNDRVLRHAKVVVSK